MGVVGPTGGRQLEPRRLVLVLLLLRYYYPGRVRTLSRVRQRRQLGVRRCGGAAVRRCGGAAVRRCGAAVRGEAEAVPTHTALLDGGLAILTRAARTLGLYSRGPHAH